MKIPKHVYQFKFNCLHPHDPNFTKQVMRMVGESAEQAAARIKQEITGLVIGMPSSEYAAAKDFLKIGFVGMYEKVAFPESFKPDMKKVDGRISMDDVEVLLLNRHGYFIDVPAIPESDLERFAKLHKSPAASKPAPTAKGKKIKKARGS